MAKRFFKRWYLVILIIFALALPLVSFGASLEYFRLSSGVKEFFKTVSGRGEKQNLASYGDYNIINNCGGDVFIPNNSAAEWSSFINNMPSCLTKTNRFCGDGICACPLCLIDDPNCQPCEDTVSCPEDCVAIPSSFCGNGTCEPGETCSNCETDCGFCKLPILQP